MNHVAGRTGRSGVPISATCRRSMARLDVKFPSRVSQSPGQAETAIRSGRTRSNRSLRKGYRVSSRARVAPPGIHRCTDNRNIRLTRNRRVPVIPAAADGQVPTHSLCELAAVAEICSQRDRVAAGPSASELRFDVDRWRKRMPQKFADQSIVFTQVIADSEAERCRLRQNPQWD
jgi:hypothetical protein